MTAIDFRRKTVSIESSVPPQRCLERLNALLSPQTIATLIDRAYSRQFVGRAAADGVEVQPIGPTTVNGAQVWHLWYPRFTGQVLPSGQGSRLEGRISGNVFVPVFGLIVAAILLTWALTFGPHAIENVTGGEPIGSSGLFEGLIMPAGFGLALALIYIPSYRLYRRDRQELFDFLKDAVAPTAAAE